jgi:UDP-glucose 4-epimerase
MKRCFVTGGAGFIGSHLVDLLISEGNAVTVFDNLSAGNPKNIHPKASFVEGDILDSAALDKSMKGMDYVFHLAALPRIQPSFEDPELHDRINVLGSLRVFEAARKVGVKKLVYSCSSACYGTPDIVPTPETAMISCLNPYALQKYTAEQYLIMLGNRFGVPVISLRYFNAYGPRSFNEKDRFNAYSSVIGIFKRQKDSGQPLTITGAGLQRRDFVHVFDIARANFLAAQSEVVGEIFNIGCGEATTILDIARTIGGPSTFIPDRKGEALITQADISKASKVLGWRPQLSLAQGLQTLND